MRCSYVTNYDDNSVTAIELANNYPTPDTRVYIDAQLINTTVQHRLFGSSSNGTYGTAPFSFDCYINGSGYWAFAYQDGNGNWVSTGVTADTNRHTFDLDGYNKTFKIDGGSTYSASLSSYTATDYSSTYTIKVFCRNDCGSVNSSWFSKAKLYEFKLYEAGVLKRHFIPVMRRSDGAFGVYNVVTDTFNELMSGGWE